MPRCCARSKAVNQARQRCLFLFRNGDIQSCPVMLSALLLLSAPPSILCESARCFVCTTSTVAAGPSTLFATQLNARLTSIHCSHSALPPPPPRSQVLCIRRRLRRHALFYFGIAQTLSRARLPPCKSTYISSSCCPKCVAAQGSMLQVHAAAINPVDWKIKSGFDDWGVPLPFIPG